MGKRRKFPPGTFCGINPAVQNEHVLARGFNDGKQAGLIEVPACDACNQEKSKFDAYLLYVITSDLRVDHPVAMAVFTDRVRPAVIRDKDAFLREAKARPPTTPVPIDGPFRMEIARSVRAHPFRIASAIRWIVRGLYYHIFNERLPATYAIDVEQLHPIAAHDSEAEFKKGGSVITTVGQGVFDYMYNHTDDQTRIDWLLMFYRNDSYCYRATSRPSADGDPGVIYGIQNALPEPL